MILTPQAFVVAHLALLKRSLIPFVTRVRNSTERIIDLAGFVRTPLLWEEKGNTNEPNVVPYRLSCF